jgi:peptide/nickel transport system substrate-binding protein
MKKLSLFLLLCVITLQLSASTKAVEAVIFARAADSVKLDPALIDDGESVKVIRQIFETLVAFKPGTLDIAPCLATKWQESSDRLSWVFDLQKDIKFHDGSDFNAEVVVYNFNRRLDKNHEAHKGDFKYGSMFTAITKIEKLEDYKIKFILKYPQSAFLNNLTVSAASIISPTAYKKHGEAFGLNPVGTGPWVFKKWNPDENIILDRSPNYWGDDEEDKKNLSKAAKQLVFSMVTDDNGKFSEIKTGKAHIADNLTPDYVKKAREEKSIHLHEETSMNVCYLAFNLDKKLMNQQKIRKAIALCVDVKALTKIIYKGLATPAKSILPPSIWGNNPDIDFYNAGLTEVQRVEKAKSLLKEAGVPNGFDIELMVFINPRPYMPKPKKAALYLKNILKKININIILKEKLWGEFLTLAQTGKHEMCILGWSSDNGDPDNTLYTLLSTEMAKDPANNVSFYRDEKVSSLLKAAQTKSTREERVKLYQEASLKIHDDVPVLALAHNRQIVMTSTRLKGFQLHPDGVRAMPFLYLSEAVAKEATPMFKYIILFGIALFFYIFYLYSRPRKQS